MSTLCHRIDSVFRLFPLPTALLYKATEQPEGRAWRSLIALVDARPLSAWRRLSGRRLGAEGPVGHLVYLHRCAFFAERQSRFTRADYFWRELALAVPRLGKQSIPWEATARLLETEVALRGDELRAALMKEIMLDTHLAFANGLMATAEHTSRAAMHLEYLERWLELVEAPASDWLTALLPGVEARIKALATTDRSAQALTQLRAVRNQAVLAKLSDLHVHLVLKQALSANRSGEGGGALTGGIEELQKIRVSVPDNKQVYEGLGILYRCRSVERANNGRLAEALPDADRATKYSPQLEYGGQLLGQLIKAMTDLQKMVREIKLQIRNLPDATLNEEGLQLEAEASRGFSLLEEFRNSTESRDIQESRATAFAGSLWRQLTGCRHDVPLPPVQELRALHSILETMFTSDAECEEDLAEMYRAHAAQVSLPTVDAETVAEFVLRRQRARRDLRDADELEVSPEPPDGAVAPSIALGEPAGRDRLPIAHWLLGRQDIGTRMLAAGAMAYAVAVAAFGFVESRNHRIRNEAIQQLSSAREDPRNVVHAAERFLQADPLVGRDGRRDEVLRAYAWGIAIWFAQLDDPAEAEMQDAIAKFRELAMEGETP